MEFHIRCDAEEIARYVFCPGDHARAKKIAGNITPVIASSVHARRAQELRAVTSANPEVVNVEKLNHK